VPYERNSVEYKIPAVVGNRLLALLPRKHQQQFLAECEEVELVFGDIISEDGDRIRHVYFPTGDSFISLITRVEGSPNLEVGMVGNEGMSGISLMFGVHISPLRTLVQGSGTAVRMKAAAFTRALENRPPLVKVLNRYLYVLMTQLAQTAACTRFHVVEARLARWLLMTQDRSHSHEFDVTQEFLSYMLGVRRVGVTKAAGALHKQGLINYSRGHVRIVDRSGLVAAACACYKADVKSYKSMLG
jgi:Crp-like helix-turn-helix domain